MLKVVVLKNDAECISQRIKWTSVGRVMIILDCSIWKTCVCILHQTNQPRTPTSFCNGRWQVRAPSPCHRILRWHGAVIHRKMYFAVNVSDEHDVQSHMFRPTITDMQDKYCGDCYDIYTIQSQYTKVAAFGRHRKRGGFLCIGSPSVTRRGDSPQRPCL